MFASATFCWFTRAVAYLEPVDQFFLYGVLSGSIRGYTQTFCCLSEPLLLILVLRVGRCSLTAHIGKKKRVTDTAHNNDSEQRSASELQQTLSTDDRMWYLAVRDITTTFCLLCRHLFSVSSQIIRLTRQLMFPKCKSLVISLFYTVKQLPNSDRNCLLWSTEDAFLGSSSKLPLGAKCQM